MPTNPMMPQSETMDAVIKDAMSIAKKRNIPTLNPKLFALPSPNRRASYLEESNKKNANPIATMIAKKMLSLGFSLPISPNDQYTALASVLSAAKNCINVVNACSKAPNPTPIKMMVVG